MDKFLKKYYKQLHFNAMPDGVRARFLDWIKNGTLTDDMRHWVRDYMTQNSNGTYSFKELPDPANDDHLSKDEAKQLFIAFQSAFAGMAADKAKFKDSNPQAYEFVDNYFGENKLFNVSPATQKCADGIKNMIALIASNPQVKRIVLASKSDDGKAIFDKESDLDDFLSKCAKGDYNKNGSVQRKVQKVAAAMENAAWSRSGTNVGAAIENIHESLTDVMDKNAFAMNPDDITDTQLKDFREIYSKTDKNGLLQTLYYNKNVRSKFAAYDNGAITGPIEKAEESVNYQDNTKGNYVDPKIKDVKTPLQRLESWATDTYEDYFAKYSELRGGKLFYTEEGKEIFKAIDKVKIKPSDGLKTLLDKASEVEGKINTPEVREYFKWFVETMKPIADKMPKAVAGAWNNSTQMKAIITQIILKAADPKNHDPHAMEKAVTAMEIMNAMKYGMMTSKIMDAMKQTEFSIFSDGKLSWNQNEGIQFVTRAFDKTIKAAFLAVGYAVTIAGNKINLSGMQITNDGALAKTFKEVNKDLAQDASLNKQRLQNTIANINNTITGTETERDTAETNLRNSGVDIDRRREDYKTQIEHIKKRMEDAAKERDKHQPEIDKRQGIMDRLQSAKDNFDELTKISRDQNLTDLQTEITEKNRILNEQIRDQRNSLRTPIGNRAQRTARDTAVYQMIAQLTLEITKNNQELAKARADQPQKRTDANRELNDRKNYGPGLENATLSDVNREYMNAERARDAAQRQFDAEDRNVEDAKRDLDALMNEAEYKDINKFDEANQKLDELIKTREKEQNALDNWDQEHLNKVEILRRAWNSIQTGEMIDGTTVSNLVWFGSTKAAQERLDTQLLKQKLLQNQNY